MCATRSKRRPNNCNRPTPCRIRKQTVTKCSKTRGRKGTPQRDPTDPPRRRANQRRGRGAYAKDRPPIVGGVGRNTGHVRVRVKPDTTAQTLCGHVHGCTRPGSVVDTDESNSYPPILRPHAAVCHSRKEWARDDDGDGLREVQTNLSKACGPAGAPAGGLSVAFIRTILAATSPSTTLASI